MRAAQMVQIFDREFAGQRDRLVRVLATQTGWHGLEEQLAGAKLAGRGPGQPRAPDAVRCLCDHRLFQRPSGQ